MNAVMHMRAQTELATIYEISKILTSSLDVSKTCREALNVLANNMGYRRCMIIVDTEEGELHLLAAVGLSPEEYDAGHYRPGEGIIGKVYSNGMPAVVHDLAAEPFFLNRTGALDHIDGERIALAAMPIRVAKEVVGVITIDRVSERAGGGFNDDIRLMTMTASLVGQALALQRTVLAERNHNQAPAGSDSAKARRLANPQATVAATAPYFHNGSLKTLTDVVRFYVRRDTNPEEWYPTDSAGVVQKFNDLPEAYRRNVNTTEVPYNRKPGDAPALSESEIADVVAYLTRSALVPA